MPDSRQSAGPHARVDAWEKAYVGIDRDPWLRRFRLGSRTHDSPQEALDFYSRLFLDAPIPMVVLTENNVVADANVAAQQLFKRSLEKLRGKPFLRVVAKDDRSVFMEITHNLAENGPPRSRPLRVVDAQGIEIETEMIGNAPRDENGQVDFVMLALLERGQNESSDIL